MSLQLLVENAIKHGIGKLKQGGEIKIHTVYENNTFALTVSNTGKVNPNFSPTGVGIKNLEKRLFLNYNDRAIFSLTQNISWVTAKIIVNQVVL